MSEAVVKIIKVDPSSKALDRGVEELQDAIAIGFDMTHPPVVVGGFMVYTLIMPKIQERIDFKTAYPSDKQKGYVCWAYVIPDAVFDKAVVSRTECSQLINDHKESGNGKPFKKGLFEKALGEMRGTSGRLEITQVGMSELHDDDIPF